MDLQPTSERFDIIGDIHGCADEFDLLLEALGYDSTLQHPEGRVLVFVGDFVDRGPKIVVAATRVMDAVTQGRALAVPGNHDDTLVRALRGEIVPQTVGLTRSLEELAALPASDQEAFTVRFCTFIDTLPPLLCLDHETLIVVHACLPERYTELPIGELRQKCLYGTPTGRSDANGLPIRDDWAAGYTGTATVVYGHTPVIDARWFGRTLNIDTGCVFGGRLTALRWPEREIVDVPAQRVYRDAPWLAARPGTLRGEILSK